MRRVITLAVLAVLGLGWATYGAPARPCTQQGTPQRDIMAGGPGRDVLCVLAGDDYAHAGEGDDLIRGADGVDTLVGGGGADVLRGAAGDDLLFVIDQRHANDRVGGGAGYDRCFIDAGDRTRGCEVVHRAGSPVPPAAFAALTQSFLGLARLGEEAQDELGTVCGGHPAPPPICEGGSA